MKVEEHQPEWFQVVIDAEPEHSQTIEAQTDARVVYDTDIEITGVGTKVALIELATCFQNQGSQCKHRFDLNIFYIWESVVSRQSKLRNRRRIPRFKNKKVCGSLTSISLLTRLIGKTGSFGGRPWRRISSDRSPPR
jgi:hypothetical protein